MLQKLIDTLTRAGLVVEFQRFPSGPKVSARIKEVGRACPRGGAFAETPEAALSLAACRGLAAIFHRVKGGFLSLEEEI